MFKRFSTRGGAPGTGLGLAIAKQMVDLMGGSIRFDSDPTVKPGTNCVVVLPLKLCEKPPKEELIHADAVPLQEPLSILIVDDAKMNRAMLKRRFVKSIAPNCVVTEAPTGEEALSICERESFDVIVLDQYMEGAGGVLLGTDTAIAMRRSKINSIIVGCSGNDLDDEFRAAGADLVWKKPMPSNSEIIRHLRQELATEEKC
jgi:CheY-like chemotaxis protein